MIEITSAKADDYLEYHGSLPPYRVHAWTAREGGKIVAIGGFAVMPTGEGMMFLDADENAQNNAPLTLCKMAKKVLREARERGFRSLIAVCDEDIEAAPRFLKWLGFKEQGEVYVHEV